MEYKDYYHILGIAKNASQDEIKRAYRKLTRKYHPDVSREKDAEKKFKEVGEAYEVLKDPEKRAAYDRLGANWQQGQDFRPPPGWTKEEFSFGGGFTDGNTEGFSDFFESLFGGRFDSRRRSTGRRATYRRRGEDFHGRLVIDLEDAFRGATRTVTMEVPETGHNGLPRIRSKEIRVRIPPGVTEGQHIRLPGQGGELPSGSAGDLFLEIVFRPHPFYRVDGRDLYLDLPVAPWEAALGARVKVPTPGGVVDLQIPANSADGKRLRLKGRGLPGEPAGHLYVNLKIVLPPANNAKAKELYRKMERELAFNPRAALGV
ncbi:DnaJ C-terminal domain-containing protein [Geoalkalibacter subterraneus]|jgi:curved DNA-binding protein|uniref:Cytochrome C biogenesis protein n=1 Tax=Geoalkalibacter subterraneus TaxID=483547 RepID=A0A0B5FN84_9BACT|nr:DnaJ C-terminal domain-containing protein [Geoalkalibacter subterraneus]AJF05460.1 cytochrome C biogenesis protein [Geoalkalibacter subterraneus]